MAAMRGRMRKEIGMLERDPPFGARGHRCDHIMHSILRFLTNLRLHTGSAGVSAWPKDDQIDRLDAQILGPDGSPYEKGVFLLDIEVPERYPFEPPKVRFVTPIYHPNIDDAGRICLDTLKMQPKGSWLPSVNLSTLLTTIRLLMAEPNADDGLMPEIADIFKHNRELFNRKATEMTVQHARNTQVHHPKPSADMSVNRSEGESVADEEFDPPTQDTQVAEVPSQPRESESSDDSFSDGGSSSEEDDGGSADDGDVAGDKETDANPPAKRRRQE
ncbi:Ubiquitin-conjugating enzyme E2 T [Phytophthora pseudosyringae]|uniref:E2 ubiquitin-conjugating enzyme n=1 Tax=Phytophthora pseudosyringae TaxID=221518 RepID=A0A8T1WGZ7_9STRA|nr:Ubiquitin-conjugating enzyme E2 T [Phytophthora pseudosyringae]